MSASVGLLGYFILEASELVEQLDAAIAAAGATGPDAGSFTRTARKLRGSATMARLTGMAELGAAIERVGRALRDGNLNWSPAVRSALVASVDDVRTLLRAVRSWGLEEDARVSTRVAELQRYTPPRPVAPAPLGGSPLPAETPSAGSAVAPSSNEFVAQGAAESAAAIEGAIARADDRQAYALAMGRVRALRGLAAVRDVPAVGEVVDALDRQAKPVEHDAAPLGAREQAVLGAAVRVLRQAADDLRGGRTGADAGASALPAFAAAVGALDERRPASDRVVPIASLFFEDAGPHLVARAPNPPTTPAARFRMEAVSVSEHLRRAVAVARASDTVETRDRALRELRQAVRALGESAASFGEASTVRFVRTVAGAAATLDPSALDALDEGAAVLADPRLSPADSTRRLDEIAARVDAAMAAAHQRARMETPTGRQLYALLETGIAGIDRLNAEPLSEPAALSERTAGDDVVPIARLLYRGRAALLRARSLREELRARGTEPTPDDVAELFDLLDLAAE